MVVGPAPEVEQAVCTARSPGETQPAWSLAAMAAEEEAEPVYANDLLIPIAFISNEIAV